MIGGGDREGGGAYLGGGGDGATQGTPGRPAPGRRHEPGGKTDTETVSVNMVVC